MRIRDDEYHRTFNAVRLAINAGQMMPGEAIERLNELNCQYEGKGNPVANLAVAMFLYQGKRNVDNLGQ